MRRQVLTGAGNALSQIFIDDGGGSGPVGPTSLPILQAGVLIGPAQKLNFTGTGIAVTVNGGDPTQIDVHITAGVASVNPGTGISITGTASAPIVNFTGDLSVTLQDAYTAGGANGGTIIPTVAGGPLKLTDGTNSSYNGIVITGVNTNTSSFRVSMAAADTWFFRSPLSDIGQVAFEFTSQQVGSGTIININNGSGAMLSIGQSAGGEVVQFLAQGGLGMKLQSDRANVASANGFRINCTNDLTDASARNVRFEVGGAERLGFWFDTSNGIANIQTPDDASFATIRLRTRFNGSGTVGSALSISNATIEFRVATNTAFYTAGVADFSPGADNTLDLGTSATTWKALWVNTLSNAAFILVDRLKWKAANEQATVGAAGGASVLPITPTKYFKITDSTGATLVVPAYAAA